MKTYWADPVRHEFNRAEELEREALAAEQNGSLINLASAARLWLEAFGSWRRLIFSAPAGAKVELLDRAGRAAGAAANIAGQLAAHCKRCAAARKGIAA